MDRSYGLSRTLAPEDGDLVDADVHAVLPSLGHLAEYLPARWRDYIAETGFADQDLVAASYPPLAPTTGPSGSAAPGVVELKRQLDACGASLAIVGCCYPLEGIRNPDLAAALAHAINDWLIGEWLDRDLRLRASAVLPVNHPEDAAREIERVAAHPGISDVMVSVRSEAPYGNRRYLPLFEAAARHGLPVRLQFGGAPGVPPTAAGWPTYYIEEYAGMASVFQTQLTSLVAEGVFDRFPTLRVLACESGFAWLPAYLWRFDKEWKGLRREVPWMRRSPTEYLRDHARFTLQPVDSPDLAGTLGALQRQFDTDATILFTSDFPHLHDPGSGETRERLAGFAGSSAVLAANARAWLRI